MDPTSELLALPEGYGRATRLLTWPAVRARVVSAAHYWLATVRPDGRPHAVPVDGVWADEALFFGGSAMTVHHRNLLASRFATVHLEDGAAVVVVDGEASLVTPDRPLAEELARLSNAKTGYGAPVAMFETELWRLRPTRVLAWTAFPTDATRFVFGGPD